MYYSQYKAENKGAAVLIHLVSGAAGGGEGAGEDLMMAFYLPLDS